MHLSMLSPRGFWRILIIRDIPRVGNLTWPPSWIMKRAFLSPSSKGKALGIRLLGNDSAILENTQKAFECTSRVQYTVLFCK